MNRKKPKLVENDYDPANLVPEGFERDDEGELVAIDLHPTAD